MLQQFLRIYRLIPNLNAALWISPAELMFATKIKLVFDKLLPGRKIKSLNIKKSNIKSFKAGDKVFFRSYKARKESWEDGKIILLLGRMMYMVQG